MNIRRAQLTDLDAIRELFRAAVEVIGPQAYTDEQVAAWASFADADTFPLFDPMTNVFVAEDVSGILGFCGLSMSGYLASLYVRPDACRQGIGSKLLQHAIDCAVDVGIARLHTEASHFSRPLFLKHGFTDAGTEDVERAGVIFTRFLMERVFE